MYKVQEPERSWQRTSGAGRMKIQASFYCVYKHQALYKAHGFCAHLSFTIVHIIEIRKQSAPGKKVSDPSPSYSPFPHSVCALPQARPEAPVGCFFVGVGSKGDWHRPATLLCTIPTWGSWRHSTHVNLKINHDLLKTLQTNVRREAISDACCLNLLSLSVDIPGFILIYYTH